MNQPDLVSALAAEQTNRSYPSTVFTNVGWVALDRERYPGPWFRADSVLGNTNGTLLAGWVPLLRDACPCAPSPPEHLAPRWMRVLAYLLSPTLHTWLLAGWGVRVGAVLAYLLSPNLHTHHHSG